MKKWTKAPILWLLLVLVTFSACRTQPDTSPNDNQDASENRGGTVMVYAREQYRYALQQAFSHLSLSESELRIFWTGDPDLADVLITDNIPQQQLQSFRPIDTDRLTLKGIEALEIRDSRGVIALPLFLRLDGFWYDEQLYATRELTAPQSLNSWQSDPLREECPAVWDPEDTDELFWGVVAPYYLYAGGELQTLTSGQLRPEPLQTALARTAELAQNGLLTESNQAQQSFINQKSGIWLAGNDQLAASYHSMSNLSSWRISGSLPFAAQERACCVVRADVVAVRIDSDQELTDRFLSLFYNAQTVSDLSVSVRMPAACQMHYTPVAVPELNQICYTLLSSPAMDVHYSSICWPESRQGQVESVLLALMRSELTAQEAANQICQ